jgi:ribonuclease J
MKISFIRMKNWIDYFGLEFFQAHCSGHICSADLKELIEEVNPKKLYPIHTEYPGMFRKLSPEVKMVKEGKKYCLG